MPVSAFSAKESLRYGWNTFRERPWIFVGATALVSAVSIISSDVITPLTRHAAGSNHFSGLTLIAFLVQVAIATLVGAGQLKFMLRAYEDTSTLEIRDLWAPELFWPFFLMSTVSLFAICFGLVLFVIPGLILGVMWIFSGYFIADTHVGAIESLRASARITKGHRWNLFWFILLLAAISLLGLLAFLVGMLVATPVTMLATVHAYRTLKEKSPTPASPFDSNVS
jgi:uncharacterized membrane protein